jgi:superfamily I DNA and/or RNA helicase
MSGEKKRQLESFSKHMGLQGIQMHTLVFQHVDTHQNDPECHELRVLSERDSSYDSPLNGQEIIRMKDLHGKILGEILSRSKVVATTLSNASQECLKSPDFKPSVNVSDDAGQSMEGENMIPMTMESMRVVVLIGDPYQLPPTVMSDGANEGAEFLKRSLLARLMEAGYPQVSLNIDYRNHPQILELFNKAIYSGKLISGR